MLFCAPYTISLDAITLLDATDLVAALPKFEGSVEGEDLDFIGADYKEPVERGNVLQSVSWTAWRKFADVAAAADFQEQFSEELPRGGALVIGGTTYPKARLGPYSVQGSEVDATYLIMTFTVIYGGPEA